MSSDDFPDTKQVPPPPYTFRVTRYDPADRDEHGHYTGSEDTRSDRGAVEAAYLAAVAAFAHDTGITHLTTARARSRERISLSRKAVLPDPLSQVTNVPGDLVPGRVTKLLPFGAFVLLGAGFAGAVEGLVSLTELSEQAVRHPEDELRVGDELTVRILTIDRQRRQISLSLRPVPPASTDTSR